jgi:hypothetical protein
LPPDGQSETLQIFGPRIGVEPAAMYAFLQDGQKMEARLWQNIPLSLLARVEEQLREEAARQLLAYWQECEISWHSTR